MKIISGQTKLHLNGESAVVIGKFDGMHRGHQYLILELLRCAAAPPHTLNTVVFTFDPSPAVFFSGQVQPELFTKEEKRRVFARLGIDLLIEYPMNADTAKMPAETFVSEVLCEALCARLIVAGSDLTFGHKGQGNVALLESMKHSLGYETCIVDKLIHEGREISSTYVREMVSEGRMEDAAHLLGAPYTVSGPVQHGKRLGHTIGFPTVNLLPPAEKLLPPDGVYFTRTRIGDTLYDGMTNIGVRPTVSSDGTRSVETHLFDCDEDLYGREIEVDMLHFHRKECAFADVNALKEQIGTDRGEAEAFFAELSAEPENTQGRFGKRD